MGHIKTFDAKKIWPGKTSGPALVSKERICFSGGSIDPERGTFNTPMTGLAGASYAGAVLIFISGKGATAGSRRLDIACRFGNAPAAMINIEIDPITAIACALQDIPLVQIEDFSIFDQIKNGDIVTVDADQGKVIIGQEDPQPCA